MKKKFALALSGGGLKGAFQVGALEYILGNKVKIDDDPPIDIKFDIIAGVSVGSLNGALLATDRFPRLVDIWFNELINKGPSLIYTSDYISIVKGEPKLNLDKLLDGIGDDFNLGFWKTLASAFVGKKKKKKAIKETINKVKAQLYSRVNDIPALANNNPLYQLLKNEIYQKDIKDVIYKMGYVSLVDGKYKVHNANEFPDDSQLRKAILASTAIPIVFPDVDEIITNQDTSTYNVDGGIRNISPLKDVLDEIGNDPDTDAEYHVIVINTAKPELDRWGNSMKPNLLMNAKRSLVEITLSEIFNNDIEQFLFINRMLKQLGKNQIMIEGKAYKQVKIKVIQPSSPIGDTLDASKQILLDRRAAGKEAAIAEFGAINWNV